MATTATERATLNHLLGARRVQMAAMVVAIKLIDEILAAREKNVNTEVVWSEDQDIVFVEEQR